MLPERPAPSVTKSEKEVFRLIRDAEGSEDYTCLHSIGLARHRRKPYSEADFIVIAPEGIFCLEAKGGHVRREAGVWTIGWPSRQYTSCEGPFKQSQNSMYPLMDEVEQRISSKFRRKILFGWGVIFPDIRFEIHDPEWDPAVVCDITNKHDFVKYIRSLAQYARERERVARRTHVERISHADRQRLIDCFRRDFDLVPRISDLISESERELAKLSEQQYSILRYALEPENPRILCPGAAGTGKTLIGLEAARRLGRQGKRVLLVCYNRLLANHLQGEISVDGGDVEIWSIHQYMRDVIQRSGRIDQLRGKERHTKDTNDLFQNVYPNLFETAILEVVDAQEFQPFDVLIVDEGQDILFSPTIDALALTLRGGLEEGNWILLFDPDLQSEVYGRMDARVLDTLQGYHPAHLPLHENFRNPEAIVDEMCAVTGVPKPICRRQFASRVDYRTYKSDQDEGKKLRALLVELLAEGVSPSSITILSSRRRKDACVERYPPEVGKRVAYLDDERPGNSGEQVLTACSISAFKGMENEIIILTDVPEICCNDQWSRSIFYVGMTRARTRLYAMVGQKFLTNRLEELSAGAAPPNE